MQHSNFLWHSIRPKLKHLLTFVIFTLLFLLFFISALTTNQNPISAMNNNNENNSLNNINNKGKNNDAFVYVHKTDANKREESCYVYNIKQNSIFYGYRQDIQRAPASTTKILTGLVALEELEFEESVTVGSEVNVQGSSLGLKVGDQITVRELLKAMYTISANDAAAALAVKASGSIEKFAEKMNAYARNLGCYNSNFTNPHGLPDPSHFSTAEDLAKIALEFIKHKDLLKFTQKQTDLVKWKDFKGNTHSLQVKNTNKLLGVYPGITGLKTGTTTEAGQCIIAYYNNNDEEEFLIVVLGAQQRYRSVVPLLDEVISQIAADKALSGLAADPKILFSIPGIY